MKNNFEGVDIESMIDKVTDKLKDELSLSAGKDRSEIYKDKNDEGKVGNLVKQEGSNEKDKEKIERKKSKYDQLFSSSYYNEGRLDSSEDNNSHIDKAPSLTSSTLKRLDSIKRTDSFQKEDYLLPVDWKSADAANIAVIEKEFSIIGASINKTDYLQLCSTIEDLDIASQAKKENKYTERKIGTLSSLHYLVMEQFFYDINQEDLMSLHMVQLSDFLLKYRHIEGDGNCFYRAIIFSFLEHIIVTKTVILLKEVIIDINRVLGSNTIEKVNKTLIINILYLMSEALDNDNPSITPYEILIKSFIYCQQFDYGMILYFRYLLYDYITINKTKIYSPEFSVKIGNLLPVDYETINGEFLYDKFFKEDLLQMGSDAEKIVIYLTPYVLKCDLNVIIYEYDSEDTVTAMKFPCYMENKPRLEVLYRKTHYDIIYNKAYYDQYNHILDYFINLHENDQHLIKYESPKKSSYIQSQIEKKNSSNVYRSIVSEIAKPAALCFICDTNYSSQANIFQLCPQCLTKELNDQILDTYIYYLKLVKNQWKKGKCDFSKLYQKFFDQQSCSIIEQNVLLKDAVAIAGNNLNTMINNAKKVLCVECLKGIIQNNKQNAYCCLPCGCFLCSKLCLEKYFLKYLEQDYAESKESLKKYMIFPSCLCGYQFNYNDYEKLYVFFDRSDLKKLRNVLKETIMKNLNMKCMTCLAGRGSKGDFYQIVLKDEKIAQVYNEKKFCHILCSRCREKIGSNMKKIECCLCNNQHNIQKIQKIDPNKNDDECIIF